MPAPLAPKELAGLMGLLTHDMRNPLSALHSNLNYLLTALAQVREDLAEAATDAVASCDGLMHVIENMETLSFYVGGAEPMPHSTLSLSALTGDVVERVRVAAQSHGVALEFKEELPRSVRVRSSRQLLARAVENLVRGAVQYSPAGQSVEVRVQRVEGSCQVRVSDLGPSLGGSDAELVFSPEGQLRSKMGGTGRYTRGLGLLAAKVCADAAGATLRAVPLTGGQAFELTLPVHG
jgi:two-component system OmpR family sensor kinase